MAVYMISYDLHSPTKNREKVEDAIKSMGSWCKYVSTTFLVSTNLGPLAVQDAATKYLDSNDRMVIAKTDGNIMGWLNKDQWNWIHQNL